MLASELIKMLQEKIKLHGDCVIYVPDNEMLDEAEECSGIRFYPAESCHDAIMNYDLPDYFYLKS